MALLGIARTTQDGKIYIQNAEEFLQRNNSNRNRLLYLNTKANLTDDIKERNALVLKSLRYFDEEYDIAKQISLFSSIVLNYQILENPDSAFFYLKKIEISIDKILHYYTIKAYIQSKNFKLEEAFLSVDKIIEDTPYDSV